MIQLHIQYLLRMRSAFLLISFLIYNSLDRRLDVSSVRLHDLDRLAHRKLIPLLDPVQAVLFAADDPR